MLADLRFAFRQLLKSPGFTAVALLTLTLGIGVNTTSFSVLNALLIHTVPYAQPDQLVRLYQASPQTLARTMTAHSPANFLDYRAQNGVFTHLAAVLSVSFNLGEPGQPADQLRGMRVTADFFPLLGTRPELGRTFTPEDDRPGNNAVLVISHGLWLQRFGADPAIIGRQIRIDGEPVTIVGVMPAAFDDYPLWGEVGAWQPMALSDQMRGDRDNTFLVVIARRKAAISPGQAQSAMSALAAQLALAYPQFNAQRGLSLVSLGASIQDDLGRNITWLVMGLAGFVLLIACANLANLQFARSAARGREHAIRVALGASRAKLIREVLTESVLLSLAGGAVGLVLALWTNDLIGRNFVWADRIGFEIPLDLRVLGFTFGVSGLTGVGFGLLPACLASRANVSDALKPGSRGSTASRTQHRVRHALIVAEVALALVLLAGAGFFFRGLQRFAQRNPGWHTDGLLTAYMKLAGPKYADAPARNVFFRQLEERLATHPALVRATIASSLPTSGFNNTNSFVVEGRPEPAPGSGQDAAIATTMPGYFETLGIRLKQGRDFAITDRADSPNVVIINESMARKLWPGENPLGKRIGSATPFMSNPREIVGVVSDVRPVANLGGADGRFQMYRPLTQRPPTFASIALRTHGAPETFATDLRRLVAEMDPDVAVYRIGNVQQEIGRGFASLNVAAWTLAGFALLGVLLAAVGIYGVIANAVVQRTNEIGIRMALGAQVSDIFTLILGGGLRLTFIGAAIGLAGSLGIAQLLRAISPEFSAADASVTSGVTAFLILVAALACWLPARRATKVDPMIALRAG